MLYFGTYQTRIGRIVELYEMEPRTRLNADKSTKQVTIFRGKLFQANGRDVESIHEWEQNDKPEPAPPGWAMGAFLQQSAVEGVPHQFDLVILVQQAASQPIAQTAPQAVPQAGQVGHELFTSAPHEPAKPANLAPGAAHVGPETFTR